MADSQIVINFQNVEVDTPELAYTSPANGEGVKIKAFTCTNNGETNQNYLVYLVQQGESPDQAISPFTLVARETKDHGSAVVGHVLQPGYSLWIESGATAGQLVFNVAGQAF